VQITLAGKVALVTGGGAGIGRAIVQAYSDLGAALVVAEVDPAKCADLRAAFPDAEIVQTDVRDAAQVETVRAAIEKRHGKLDVLVNNVGHHLGVFKPLVDLTEQDWDDQHEINLRHMFLVTKAMIPLMRKCARPTAPIR
jgi:NAD(P)-dependent dehydrogenase (short-subunit alcohol dehydrogenase family)